uniref:Protein scribble homolog n=1 Tax=Callorhinchus milii TaxID=7868 RepID=A0A4W3GKV1_CALMI
MREARHDQAVALLTGSAPTITMLIQRELAEPLRASEGQGEGQPEASPTLHRARPHSPPPPSLQDEEEVGPDTRIEEPPTQPNHFSLATEDEYPVEEVVLLKTGGPLGLSIVGGSDHASHPFGIHEPGVFISKVGLNLLCVSMHVPARTGVCQYVCAVHVSECSGVHVLAFFT